MKKVTKIMTKTPVKVQKNGHKTVGGVAHKRYVLLDGAEVQKYGMPNTVSKPFVRKGGGQ